MPVLKGRSGAYTWSTDSPNAGVSIVVEDAARFSVHGGLSKIAFDRDVDDWYDVLVCDLNGQNIVAFSALASNLATKHVGNPVWHPSGGYIVVQMQLAASGQTTLAKPGIGLHNELWAITYPGGVATQLKAVAGSGSDLGLLHPQFNADGTKLAWAHMHANAPGGGDSIGGEWDIHTATWSNASLSSESTYTPEYDSVEVDFYETHGWNSDGTKMLYTKGDETDTWKMDVFEGALSGAGSNLSNDSSNWCEHGKYSPSFNKIAYMSSKSTGQAPADDSASEVGALATELFIMDVDGSNQKRLTNFNREGYPEYASVRTVVGDLEWGPDGTYILAKVQRAGAIASEDIWKIDLVSGDQDP